MPARILSCSRFEPIVTVAVVPSPLIAICAARLANATGRCMNQLICGADDAVTSSWTSSEPSVRSSRKPRCTDDTRILA